MKSLDRSSILRSLYDFDIDHKVGVLINHLDEIENKWAFYVSWDYVASDFNPYMYFRVNFEI